MMTSSVGLLALAATLGLSACQRQEPDRAASPPAATAPPSAATQVMDVSQPLTARGTKPFWALSIDGKRLKLSRPEQAEVVAEAPGAAISPGRAAWVATAADGGQLTVILYASECSDGVSDLKYPMAAEVVLIGETLHGCAAKTAKLPRSGG